MSIHKNQSFVSFFEVHKNNFFLSLNVTFLDACEIYKVYSINPGDPKIGTLKICISDSAI